jgi:hypothetical protein
VRVYVPATQALLAGFVEAGHVPAGERFVAADDSEEAEYDALVAAAEAAADLLDAPGRRVVVVADVPDVDAAFAMSLVASVHADTEDVDPHGEDLPDLGWFATQEIPDLLA